MLVNPIHVKKSKELDDNSPTKDARVIAQLMKDGRYSVPNLLEGVYAELREGVKLRDQLIKQLMIIEGRIENVIQRFFLEFFDVFGDWKGKAAFYTLRMFPFPSHIQKLSPEEVLQKWKPYIQRGGGLKRATRLVEVAKKSVGIETGIQLAKRELDCLLDQYELYKKQLAQLDEELEGVVESIPSAKQMTHIRGLSHPTIALFFAEVGDLTKYNHPQQLVNLAGLSLREHSSGKYKGQTRITKRGRRRLRKALYLAIRPLVAHNPVFKDLHHYYTNRPDRPLKKQQSLLPCIVNYYVCYLPLVRNSVSLMD